MGGLPSTTRALALALILPGLAVQAHASGLLAPAEQNRLLAQLDKRPIVFFLARGPADSCGPGCNEWIAAEGRFVPGTAEKFQDFLRTLPRQDLPIFFHSAGGNAGAAAKIGLALRERRMTAGIGRTITEQCKVFAKDDPCQRLIASGGEIRARLRGQEGQCHSACIYAFIGASNRRMPGGAVMGVHSARLDAKLRQQAMQRAPSIGAITLSAIQDSMGQYVTLMGIDPRLQQIATKVDSRRIYVLSRDKIARFGVVPGEFYETPWASFTDPSKLPIVLKSATRAMDAERREYRMVGVQFRCFAGAIWLVYERELPPNEVGYASLVRAKVGESEIVLRRGPKTPTSEIWTVQADPSVLRGIVAAPNIMLTEDVIPNGNSQVWTRDTKLSSTGLSEAIEGVVKRCPTAVSDGSGRDGKR
jgi:hypothetical protein